MIDDNLPPISVDINLVIDKEWGSTVTGPQDICFQLHAHLVNVEKILCGQMEEEIKGTVSLPSIYEFTVIDAVSKDLKTIIGVWLRNSYDVIETSTLSAEGSENIISLSQ